MMMKSLILLAAATFAGAAPLLADAQSAGRPPLALKLQVLGRHDSGLRGVGGAEIVAHDSDNQRLFVINAAASSIDVLDITQPSAPLLVRTLSETGGDANSVAVHDGLVAVAFAASPKTDPGKVVFYDARTLERLAEVTVGALPDMLTFTRDGRALRVATEALEPFEFKPAVTTNSGGRRKVIKRDPDGRIRGRQGHADHHRLAWRSLDQMAADPAVK